ncbi:uncharacterized protein LOC132904186 [Amyelois transitella]|uniref:uncharacterized protein LOC132904186 n=1 Tax=Amyelois transitella TaxID=680683 RepID=UPI00298F8BC2|nr:uncharacterized protein LOC132904186 [Amyelois transitella]
MLAIRDEIHGNLAEIMSEIKSLRSDHIVLKRTVDNLEADLSSLKCSVQLQTEELNSLDVRVKEISTAASERTTVAVSHFESKIDALEQQARQCNVEICNIPERRNENLTGIVEAIGSAIKFQVEQRDIVSIHRVPHAQSDGNRPKNIIVKFCTRIQRDNFLSSFRKGKTLKTDQVGIPGTSSAIFINEHLTLKRKQLFRKCREFARKNQYKYVWIKNAIVLLRERDDSAAFAIRCDDDLAKIVPKKNARIS